MAVPSSTPEEKLNWEVEKLHAEVRNLGRTFFTAVVLAVAGAVTAGYNVLLKQFGGSKVREDPTKLEGAARPRHYDIWLPRSDG